MTELVEYYPLRLAPLETPSFDPGEHPVIDAEGARIFSISGNRERAEAIVATLNAAGLLTPAAGAWQPIETAPHNTSVLLAWRDWHDDRWCMSVGAATTGQRFENGYSNLSQHGSATHWQPLPSSPGAALAEPTTVAADLDGGDARPNSGLDSRDRGHNTSAQSAVKPLAWEEVSRGGGHEPKEIIGWEADSGFGPVYEIEQYFGSDSFGFQLRYDGVVAGDFDDPDQAKKRAQDHFNERVLGALSEGDLAPESYRETVRKVAAAREKRLADLSDANVELRSALSQFQNVCAAWKDCDSVVTTVDLSVIRKALSLPSTDRGSAA